MSCNDGSGAAGLSGIIDAAPSACSCQAAGAACSSSNSNRAACITRVKGTCRGGLPFVHSSAVCCLLRCSWKWTARESKLAPRNLAEKSGGPEMP